MKYAYEMVMAAYKPLTYEEEQGLIARTRGNEGYLRDLLIYHNIGIAVQIANRYCYERMDSIEDAIQRCLLGLYKASRTYDLDSGIKFLYYAQWKIIAECRYPFHRNLKDSVINKRLVSLDEPMKSHQSHGDDDSTLMDYLNVVISEDYSPSSRKVIAKIPEIDKMDFRAIVSGIVDSLTRFSFRDRQIYKHYILSRMESPNPFVGESALSLESIGNKFGMTKERVRQIVEKISSVVRQRLMRDYGEYDELEGIIRDYKRHLAEKDDFGFEEHDEALDEEAEYIEAVKKEREEQESEEARQEMRHKLRMAIYQDAFDRQSKKIEESEANRKRDGWSPNYIGAGRLGRRYDLIAVMAHDRNKKKKKDWEKKRQGEKKSTYWLPVSKDRMLRDQFAFERYQDRMKHPDQYAEHARKKIRLSRRQSLKALRQNMDVVPTVKPGTEVPAPHTPEELEAIKSGVVTAEDLAIPTTSEREKPAEMQEEFASDVAFEVRKAEEIDIGRGFHTDDEFELQDEN